MQADNGLQADAETAQIVGLFSEQELSLDKVKETSVVFYIYRNGFTDARELHRFLYTFGFLQMSENGCAIFVELLMKTETATLTWESSRSLSKKVYIKQMPALSKRDAHFPWQ